MADVTTEVQPDGTTEVVDASGPTNYEFSQQQVGADLPEVPSSADLAKLFTPRLVLNVTAPDGTVIPFVFKRMDPGTLLLTHGSPVSIPVDVRERARALQVDLDAIRGADGTLDDASAGKAIDLLQSKDSRQVLDLAQTIRKNTVMAAVISPVMTEELYDNLDDEVLEALYDAITGGVTSDTELVETFPEGAPTTEA